MSQDPYITGMDYNFDTYAQQIRFGWLDRYIDSIVIKKRNAMWKAVLSAPKDQKHLDLNKIKNCLDVGTTSDEHYESSNFFLKQLPPDIKISTFSDQIIQRSSNARNPSIYHSYQGSICSEISIKERFDLVICSATLEHVGSRENQNFAIKNLLGLTNKFLLITVPNRWHPIEFHSRIPMIHWFPKKIWRGIFALIPSLQHLSLEENLNFISAKSIKSEILEHPGVEKVQIFKVRLLGFQSNFAIFVTMLEEL